MTNRRLPASVAPELRRKRAEGWRPGELATLYGVCTRTIQRYLKLGPLEEVHIGPWRAYFVHEQDGPRRVTDWERR